jgi:tRNA A37 methylthiotransferase MiaB
VVNVSKFYPRPGTEAANMRQLPSSTVKERSRRMSFLHNKISLRRNQRWVRWVGDALVDEEGRKGDLIARNLSYKPIVLKGQMDLLGRKVEVTIRGATETHLKGEIVRFL